MDTNRPKEDIMTYDEDGRNHGKCIYYVEDSTLQYIYHYKHGQRHMLHEYYYGDGTIWDSIYFKNDKRFGSQFLHRSKGYEQEMKKR